MQVSAAFARDLRRLGRRYGTPTLGRTLARAIARQVVLGRALRNHSSVVLSGRGRKGRRLFAA